MWIIVPHKGKSSGAMQEPLVFRLTTLHLGQVANPYMNPA